MIRLGYSYTLVPADPAQPPVMTGHARRAPEARETVERMMTADPAIDRGVVRSLDLPGLAVQTCTRSADPGAFDWVLKPLLQVAPA